MAWCMKCVSKSEDNFAEQVLSFPPFRGSGGGTQVFRPQQKHFHPLSNLDDLACFSK